MFNFVPKDSESNSRAKVNLRGVYIEEIEVYSCMYRPMLEHRCTED